MDQSDPRKLLADVAKILNKLKIPYIVTGGIAVFVWGRPRFTADIDIVIELKTKDIDLLAENLKNIGSSPFIQKEAIEEALKNKDEFNFLDGDTGIKVDFWIAKEDEFNTSRMKRGIWLEIGGEKVRFITPEDLILAKLNWNKISPSDKQLEDIKSIFKISGEKLDRKYLTKWAKKLGVDDILKNLKEKN